MKPTRTTERGFTLAELTVALSLAVAIVAAGASLLTDYMATARTLRVQGDANIELISLIKNLTREFQTSRQSSRACVLQRISGNPEDANQTLADFQCRSVTIKTDGLGFDIDPNTNLPARAFINTCVPFTQSNLPRGKGGVHSPPRSPDELEWGGTKGICPKKCPDNHRPLIRYLDANGFSNRLQIPKVSKTGALELWGALICALRFTDSVRELQNLKGRDFSAEYINVLAFVGRGRFDVKFPKFKDSDGVERRQSYVWMTGGTVLDFLDSQEMSIYKCTPDNPNC